MTRIALSLLLACCLVGSAWADEEAPAEMKRGFVDGKFVDEYFGIVYQAEDLQEGFGFGLGGPTVLWSGKCAGGVDVEIVCTENAEERTAAAWLAAMKERWAADGKERTEMEEATEPLPHVLFVQESLAGFKRHHGYAFYPRGLQCFVVHAQVREKSDTSADAIRKALTGLQVDPKRAESFLLAHVFSKMGQRSPTDPEILLAAAMGAGPGTPSYLTGDHMKIPALALKALTLAQQRATDDTFDNDQDWLLVHGIGLAQLTLGLREEAVPTWKKAIELAAKTSDPASQACNSYYNLACAYSLLGRLDEAFEALETSFEVGGAEQVSMLKAHGKEDPDLENMRADPRWAALLGEAGAAEPGEDDEADEDEDEDDDEDDD